MTVWKNNTSLKENYKKPQNDESVRQTAQPTAFERMVNMHFNRPNVSFKVISNPWDKPELLTKFLEKPLLKSSVKPNPVIEEMLDEAIAKRSIPLHSTMYTMNVIKSKYPELSSDVKECLEILNSYQSKV